MATPQKPLHGRHHRVELLVAGVAQAFLEQVTDFDAKATFDKIRQKVLGQTGQIMDNDPTGWEGSFKMNPRTPSAITFIDAYTQAKVNNLPIRIDILETTTFRTGGTRTHVYPNCEIEFGQSVARGKPTEITVSWETGEQRIAR